MAAGLLLGAVPLVPDLPSSSRPCPVSSKHRLYDAIIAAVAAAVPARWEPYRPPPPPTAFALPSESRRSRLRRGADAKAGAAPGGPDGDESNGDDGNGDSDVDREEELRWEEELKRQLKDMEDMRELERKAEELRVQAARDDEGEGKEEETEEEKRERVRRELEKVAREQAERRATAKLMFDLGQRAYGKGMYRRSIEFLEAALTNVSRSTLLGGEIQIWLAMAYDANKRHNDCIELYRQLEREHPVGSIRRQASELRYISQAPKLKITREEMLTTPLIGTSYDWYAGSWSYKYKDRKRRRKWQRTYNTTNQLPSSGDYLGDFMAWRPPSGWEKNPTFWAAVTLWMCLVGTALFLQ